MKESKLFKLSGPVYKSIKYYRFDVAAARRFLVHFRLKRTLLVTCETFAVLKRESSSLKKSLRSGQRGGGLAQGPLNTPLKPTFSQILSTLDCWYPNHRTTEYRLYFGFHAQSSAFLF